MNEKYCILCVDDDVGGLEPRAVIREEVGYSVSCPMRALEFDAMKFHLAVLGFTMPALNGFQLLLRLRAAHASSPIVLFSGMNRDAPNNMRRAFSRCLDKKEPIASLLITIRSFLTLSLDPPDRPITDNNARPLNRRHGLYHFEPRDECPVRLGSVE